jgi:uncharacterized protein
MKRFILTILLTTLIIITPTFALKETTIYLPAVEETDYGYEGVLATLTVNIKNGSGKVYVDTWPLTKIDTQASARLGKQVACDSLYLDCSNYDFYYTIRSDAEIVGGPSGGAAFTIATLASLLDLDIDNKVFITGTINLDGSIGTVGGILEKAEIVGEKGNIFLIPYNENIIEKEKAEVVGNTIINKTSTEKINIIEYAKENWNLTVKEVKTVQEAFKYFTRYTIKVPKVEFKRTERYQEVMKKLAENLIERSSQIKRNCESKLNGSTISYKYKKQISEICEENLDKAIESFNQDNYYSAASIAFSNTISYRYGEKLIDFLNSDDKKTFIRNYLKNVEEKIFEVNTSNIELYAIIEERLSEVQDKLEKGWKSYYNEKYLQGLDYISFAEERLYSAQIWMEHANEFPDYIENKSDFLKEISSNMISETSSIITYTSLSSSNIYILYAEDYLKKAKQDYKEGNYYATIINCIKGQINAELASEILFDDKKYLIELHKKRALVEINKTNSIIGQSYFEYAQTLEEDNEIVSLIYYTYAEKLSKLNEILSKEPKKEIIIPENYIEKPFCNYEEFSNIGFIILIIVFFIGLLVGKKL